ncbi:MAG: ABC transporter substrate-binding protein [Bauldia sp.]|nr:ABC transporter substrate-binding protein [Bauldia sp.]
MFLSARTGIRAVLASVLAAAIMLPGTACDRAGASEPPEATVAEMLQQIDGLSAKRLSDGEMARRFVAIEAQYFDLTAMARAALGTYGAKLQGAELAGYVGAYRTYLADSFVFGVKKTGASTSSVLGSRTGPSGVVVVISRIRAGNKTRDTIWFMCPGGARICDVEIDGARASAKQRELFTRILHERGLKALVRDLGSGALVGAS